MDQRRKKKGDNHAKKQDDGEAADLLFHDDWIHTRPSKPGFYLTALPRLGLKHHGERRRRLREVIGDFGMTPMVRGVLKD